VIDLFDASFEEVSIVFAEGLVTDFEVLFHRFYIAFLFIFRQLLFFSCYHSIDSDKNGYDGKSEDDFYLVHFVIAS
jgi:hypothetical protein